MCVCVCVCVCERFGISVIVSLCFVVYAPMGPGASFSETPFSDLGLESVCVCVCMCVCVCVLVCVCGGGGFIQI